MRLTLTLTLILTLTLTLTPTLTPTLTLTLPGRSTMRMRTASKGVMRKQVKMVATAPAKSTSGTRNSRTAWLGLG